MKLRLTYCSAWGYEKKAVSLAEQILIEYKKDISEFALVPSDGGRFEVELDGRLIFSKVAEGRYPNFDEIKNKINSQ